MNGRSRSPPRWPRSSLRRCAGSSGRPRGPEHERSHAVTAGATERAQGGPETLLAPAAQPPLTPALFPIGAGARRRKPRSGPRARGLLKLLTIQPYLHGSGADHRDAASQLPGTRSLCVTSGKRLAFEQLVAEHKKRKPASGAELSVCLLSLSSGRADATAAITEGARSYASATWSGLSVALAAARICWYPARGREGCHRAASKGGHGFTPGDCLA